MSARKAILLSSRFHPGHLSHLLANYKTLVEGGFSTRFCWHKRFSILTNGEYDEVTGRHSDVYRVGKGDLVVVWFPSVMALLDMMVIRAFTNATLIYVFHEPYSSLKSYRLSGFGLIKTAKIALVSLVSYAMVSVARKVILPSTSALAAYAGKYDTDKQHARIPLMFDDEAGDVLPEGGREYVSYIGTIAEDHAFDEFARFAHAMLVKGCHSNYRILIATRSTLSPELTELFQPFVRAGAAVLQCGRPLGNDEINVFYSKSFVVWNAYKRSMQSGVLPKAYMFGTPVIISCLNRSEFFVDKVTGIEISAAYESGEIEAAVLSIQTDFDRYSRSCRAFFLNTFYYRSLANEFMGFVTSESCKETS